MSFFEHLDFGDDLPTRHIRRRETQRNLEAICAQGATHTLKVALILHAAHIQLIRIQMEGDPHSSAIARAACEVIDDGLAEL